MVRAALRPEAYGSAFFLSDESWALAMREYRAGGRDAAFLLGSGLVLFVAWLSATAFGQVAGAVVRNPAAWGLDSAFTAVFGALLVGLWRGRGDQAPWLVAAGVAVAADRLLPGQWYILVGGLAGSVTGGTRTRDSGLGADV